MSRNQSAERNGNPDGLDSLEELSTLPIGRIEYHSNSDPALIDGIQRGILFVMAFWSVPSVQAFAQLTEVVDCLDPKGLLQFVVVDTDGATGFTEHSAFLYGLRGAGETLWIKDGIVQSTSGAGYNPTCFEPNTTSLLKSL